MQTAGSVVPNRDTADFLPVENDVGGLDPVTGDVLVQVTAELANMASFLGRRRRVEEIQVRIRALLRRIGGLISAQKINPWARIRLSAAESPIFPSSNVPRIGVFPLAANPIHWGHLLTGLSVMAHARLDKVLYVIAPDSSRSEDLYPEEMRRSSAAEAIALFLPLFSLVPAFPGKPAGGPASFFRLLGLNAQQVMETFYIRAEEGDAPGSAPMTVEALMKESRVTSAAHDGRLHHVSLICVGGNGEGNQAPGPVRTLTVPAPLPDVSSEAVRAALRSPLHRNELAFLPACAFRHLRMLSVFD